MRVLVVDGSRDQRQQIVAALCELTNITVVGAVGRLPGALYAIAEAAPDIVITDSELGDQTSTTLIAAAQRCIHPPSVIVFASDEDPSARDRAFDAGADQFVAKSAGLDALQFAVSSVPIARRRRAAAVARFALLGRISASFAHDLRNYHAVIGMGLSRLDRLDAGREGEGGESSNIRRALDAAGRITTSMLAYASGSVPDTEPIDLGSAVRDIVKLFHNALPNGVTATVTTHDVPLVQGVMSELEQLVLDLMLDAADEMPDGGEVAITVRPGQRSAILEVQHANAGPSRRERIAIAHAVARRHGATLQLVNVPGGSQVVVEIPAHAELLP